MIKKSLQGTIITQVRMLIQPMFEDSFFIDKSKHEKRDLHLHQLSPKIKRDAQHRQTYPGYLHMKASIATKPGT